MHRVAEHEPLLDSALVDAMLHFGCDINECPTAWNLEPQFFPIAIHSGLLLIRHSLEHHCALKFVCSLSIYSIDFPDESFDVCRPHLKTITGKI